MSDDGPKSMVINIITPRVGVSCPEHVVSAERRLGPQVVAPRSIGTPPMKDAASTATVISVHPTGDVL